ncbi:MAG: hypothetical protein C4539_06320 [Ignavibacteriales bacterium]|nr:MAG: hypothetical protein C4539_06320 [Ignavibacteriales bacterium]
MKKALQAYLINLLIYTAVFVLVLFVKTGLESINEKLFSSLFIFVFCWFAAAFLSGKLKREKEGNLFEVIRPYLISVFLMAGLRSLFWIVLPSWGLKKGVFVYSITIAFFIEVMIVMLRGGLKFSFNAILSNLSVKKFFTELLILFWVFGVIYFIRYKFLNPGDPVAEMLGILFLLWLASGILSGLFRECTAYENIFRCVWGHIKNFILFGCITIFLIFLMQISRGEAFKIVLGISIYAVFSTAFTAVIYLNKIPDKTDAVSLKLLRANIDRNFILDFKAVEKHDGFIKIDREVSIDRKLKEIYLAKSPEIYEFISNSIDLKHIEAFRAEILRSADIYNLTVLEDGSLQLYCNWHEINDFRRINQNFIEVNNKLIPGGIFIGCLESKMLRYKRFIKHYTYYLGNFFYFFDFIWHRVFPKITVLKQFYFSISKGKNRALSLAESLGRLYYCGFEIAALKVINDLYYFIGKKVKAPHEDKNPSYGPLFKMRRIGKDGKTIYVYKMRTMHPYSEYLQKFVFDRNQLQEGGKLKDDFRITAWGKVLRKVWLDELPMIINFFKGDLKIVGVRPLSQHYLSLYSHELQDRRKKYKPGLVPPFYKDMPKTLDEIMASENNYLNEYDKHPLLTDIKYFWYAFYNIVFKRARSG